jgi:glucose/arabinose dehydrogenase
MRSSFARRPVRTATVAAIGALLGAGLLTAIACSSNPAEAPADAGLLDATADGGFDTGNATILPVDARPPPGTFCSLPGSWVSTATGPEVIPDPSHPFTDLSWLTLPQGFCAHYFGTVQMTRQLRFAPGGDLFVASPTAGTTGGSNNGIAGIAILPDDNHDGYADSVITYLSGLPATQGLMFTGGYFYYQGDPQNGDAAPDHASILRVPFQAHDRKPSGAPELVTTITLRQAPEHWPKVMDIAMDGTIYITNGSSQGEVCGPNNPPWGTILRLEVDGSATPVARGFRNPIALRCETNHNVCLAAELALDYSGPQGGREKVVPVHDGDDWGYPCCATKDTPFTGVLHPDGAVPVCSGVAPESEGFIIGETPFGIDFEPGNWPAPWTSRAFVTLHGEVTVWHGSRIVAVALDPTTGLPRNAADLDGGFDMQAAIDFAKGWDDGRRDHGRPAPVTFAPDGRLFLGDDYAGKVVWIAPVGLKGP